MFYVFVFYNTYDEFSHLLLRYDKQGVSYAVKKCL